MTSGNKGSVASKIVGGAMALVVITAVVMAGMAYYRQISAMVEAEARAADLLASSVGISAASDIIKGDVASLGKSVERIRESNPGLLWIKISDQEGRVLADNPEHGGGGGQMTEQLIRPITVYGQKYGEIRMIFDRSPIEKARKEIFTNTLAVTLAILLVVMITARVWADYFAKPIVALAAAAEKVAGGDLTPRLKVTRSDELGTLTERFNEMVENLERSRAELERTLNELSTLYGVSRIINSTSDRDEILKLNIETLATGFGFSHVVIMLEIDHVWRMAMSHFGKSSVTTENPAGVTPESLGLAPALAAENPSEIDVGTLPGDWGFKQGAGHKTYAVPLRSGSHVVGLLIAGGPGAQKDGADKILSVVASQIAPPILISMMIQREMQKLTNPFDFIASKIETILDRARGFGLGLTILSFRLDAVALKSGATAVEKRFDEISRGIHDNLSDAELIVRYGANRVIAVVPGWTKPEARSALMTLELPHIDDLNISMVSYPEDGETPQALLASVEQQGK